MHFGIQHTPAGTQTGATPFDVYKLDLEDVTVSAVERWGESYRLFLDYDQIDLTTKTQTATGAIVSVGSFGWDTSSHAPADAAGAGPQQIRLATPPARYFLLVDGIDGGSTDARPSVLP